MSIRTYLSSAALARLAEIGLGRRRFPRTRIREEAVPPITPHGRDDRGQATPLWAIVLVLAGLLLIPTGLVIRAVHERSLAQNAADAAVLAGALEDEDEARAIARENGAELVDFVDAGGVVEVTVVVGDRRATARAERETVVVGSGP